MFLVKYLDNATKVCFYRKYNNVDEFQLGKIITSTERAKKATTLIVKKVY